MARKPKNSAEGAKQQAIKSARQAAKDAKYQTKLAREIYKKKIKEMRPYLKKLRGYDLRKAITPGQKGYVNKAWVEYQELTLAPHKIFRTRNKKHMDAARKVANRDSKVKFDVAFIPTVSKDAHISVDNKGGVIVTSKYVTEIEARFDMKALAADPAAEIQRVMNLYPEYSQFVLMAGKFIWNGGIERSRVIDRIVPHLMRYIPGGEGYEKRGPNSLFTNWAIGLRGFQGRNQAAVEDYLSAYHRKKNEMKRDRRKARRAQRAKYGKRL